MRHVIYLRDAFNRDTSWITQEVIEEYAAAKLRGEAAAELVVRKWSQGEPLKMNLFNELMLEAFSDVQKLQQELVDEFGIEHFIGASKTREQHCREIELAIDMEKDSKKKADLYKELREYRGWSLKPAENQVSVNVNVAQSGQRIEVPRGDAREAERIVMSVFGSR